MGIIWGLAGTPQSNFAYAHLLTRGEPTGDIDPMAVDSRVVGTGATGAVWYTPMGDGYIGMLVGCPYGYIGEPLVWGQGKERAQCRLL